MRSRFLGELSGFMQGYAAQANQGKSTLLLNDAVDLAKQGYKVAFISLEMGSENILRLLANIAGDDNNVILSRISVHEVSIGENSLRDIEQIIVTASADVAIIDYIGLLARTCNSSTSVYESMLVVTNSIRHVAMTTDTRIITSMQLSRDAVSGKSLMSAELNLLDYLNMKTVFNKLGTLTIDGKKKWIIGVGRKIIKANPIARFFDKIWERIFR